MCKSYFQNFSGPEALCSKKVHADGSKTDRTIPTEHLRRGWEEYDSKFDKHIKDWLAGELTADKMAHHIMSTAAQLRTSSDPVWSVAVKAQFPELLAGIFALYTLIKSGDAYKRFDEMTNGSAEESVTAEDSGHACSVLLCV